MPELQDLREALTHLADRVDEHRSARAASDLVADLGPGRTPGRPRGARRWHIGGPLVAAAAVAAVAVTAVVAAPQFAGHRATSTRPVTSVHPTAAHSVDRRQHTATPSRYAAGIPRPGAGTATPLRLDFTVAPVAGFTVRPLEVNRLYQSAELTADRLRGTHDQLTPPGGELYVYYRGVFDPASVPHLSAVTVDGHRGWVTRTGPPTETSAVTTDSHTDGVAWEYAPDSWALVLVDRTLYHALGQDTRTQNLALARAVHPGVSTLRLPFRLSGLPAGLHAEAASSVVSTGAAGDLRGSGTLGLADAHARAGGQAYEVGSALSVSVGTAIGAPTCPASRCRTVTLAGRAAYEYTKQGRPIELSTDIGKLTLTLDVDPAHLGRFTFTQLRDVLSQVDVAPSVTGPSTWFDARLSER